MSNDPLPPGNPAGSAAVPPGAESTPGATEPSIPFDIHPAADMFPLMTGAEFDELVEDIRRTRTIRVPVVFLRGNDDTHRVLLDGRNRLRAIERAIGDVTLLPTGRLVAIDRESQAPVPMPSIEAEGDPYEIVASLNVRRRHLSGEEKRAIVAALLKAKPERSDNATAKLARVSDKTVTAVRRRLEARSEIPNVSTRTDSKGRQQPASRGRSAPPTAMTAAVSAGPAGAMNGSGTKTASEPEAGVRPAAAPISTRARVTRRRGPARRAEPTTSTTSPAQERDKAVMAFSAILRARLAETLDDLTRLLRDERGRIVEMMSMQKRVAHIRAFMDSYGVGFDDLRLVE